MAMGLCREALFKRVARRERVSPDAQGGPSTDQVTVTFRSMSSPLHGSPFDYNVSWLSWFTNDPV